jgi:pimeloyl-ACP methyl ester carboxylesterase
VRLWWIWALAAIGAVVNVVAVFALLPVLFLPGMQILNQFSRSGGAPAPVATANIAGTTPGSLVTATTMPGVTRTILGRGLIAARVLYRSTNGDNGATTVVSGSVFVPPGEPPQGGWPVVAFAHGSVGIEPNCAPSLSDTLLGMIGAAIKLTEKGYAAAIPDYQGLGTKGVHPYPDSRTAGLNMIDSVRALRNTFSHVSDRWAAVGHSQGGGASWAADEQAATYAPELKLAGAVAASPAADVSGLVDKASEGTLTRDQRAVFQWIIESLARLHPDLDRNDYRHGAADQYWDVLTACSTSAAYQRVSAVKQLGPRDFAPRSPQAADRLRELLQQWALPQKPLSAPLFVSYGGTDTFIDAQWTTDAIRRACAMGGSVTIEFDPTKGHSEVNIAKLLDWVGDRFAGVPAKNDC